MEGSVGLWGTCQHQEEQPETRRGHWEVSRLVCCDSGGWAASGSPECWGIRALRLPPWSHLNCPLLCLSPTLLSLKLWC